MGKQGYSEFICPILQPADTQSELIMMEQAQLDDQPDRSGFNQHYQEKVSDLTGITDPEAYIKAFEKRNRPFHQGGRLKGYAQRLALRTLFDRCAELNLDYKDITVVDCGYGRGALSVYLACKGFNVIGVDISETARSNATEMASKIGTVNEHCRFLAENLENTSIDENSVDFIVGYGALHHFIKYPGVPSEFQRIMKPGAEAYFVDAFGENRLFHLFHNKEEMQRLGDVILNKKLIENYFSNFDLTLTPTDWFTMLDKLWFKLLPRRFAPMVRKVSKVSFSLDRLIPEGSRLALYLSGVCFTRIRKI